MSSDHEPGGSASATDVPRSQLVPSQVPPASDVVRDLCDTLARVGTSDPWWRRWLTITADAAQSWWRRGYATASQAAHLRHRRVLTIATAGAAALALSMTGVVVTVQENWTPARIGSALQFDAPARPANEPPDTAAERTPADLSPAAPATGDRRVADDANRAGESGADEMTVQISAIEGDDAEARSNGRARRREDRPASDDAPAAVGDSASTSKSRPVNDSASAARPAPASAPEPVAAGAAAPAPATRSNLNPGSRLASGDLLQSANGRFALVIQKDGNLVLYRTGDRPIWSTGTHGHPGAILVNQPDGNIVVNAPGVGTLWSTRTAGRTGAILVMQDDGNAVVYAGGGAVWSSGTAQ
jgi:hypothetical protein